MNSCENDSVVTHFFFLFLRAVPPSPQSSMPSCFVQLFLGIATAKGREKPRHTESGGGRFGGSSVFQLFSPGCLSLLPMRASAFQRYTFGASCKWPRSQRLLRYRIESLLTCGSFRIYWYTLARLFYGPAIECISTTFSSSLGNAA